MTLLNRIRRPSVVIALLLTLATRGSAEQGPARAVHLRNKALIQERFDAWKAGTGSPFDILAENATWTIAGRSLAGRTYRSREEFLREVIRPFNARMREGLKPVVREIVAEGDAVVVLFDGSAVARDGQRYVNSYAWFLTMQRGRIVRATAFFDSIAFDELWRRLPATERE